MLNSEGNGSDTHWSENLSMFCKKIEVLMKDIKMICLQMVWNCTCT